MTRASSSHVTSTTSAISARGGWVLTVSTRILQQSAPLSGEPSGPLRGRLRPPGDKSISHRALILGLLCVGETEIEGLLEGEDVLHTGEPAARWAQRWSASGEGRWSVQGWGSVRCCRRATDLDFGNAGTGARLMMGVVGGHGMTARFDGDASLRKRPMRRVLDPLALMGAEVLVEAEGGRCPILLKGTPSRCRSNIGPGRLGADQIGGAARRAQFARPHDA